MIFLLMRLSLRALRTSLEPLNRGFCRCGRGVSFAVNGFWFRCCVGYTAKKRSIGCLNFIVLIKIVHYLFFSVLHDEIRLITMEGIF